MRTLVLVLHAFIGLPRESAAQWQRLNVPAPRIVAIDALEGDLYVLGRDDSNYTLQTSLDGGFAWATDTVYPTHFDAKLSLNGAIELYKLKAVASNQIYVTGYLTDEWWDCLSAEIGVSLRSSDSGWKWIGTGGTLSRGAEIVNQSKDTVALLQYGAFLCGDWGSSTALYLSFDSGNTFTRGFSQFYAFYYAMQSNRDIAYVLSMPNAGGLAITHNAGESWDTVLIGHQLENIEASGKYWRATSYGDSAWYSSNGTDWIFDPLFILPPSTKVHYKWTGDSLLTSVDSGRTFTLHSRLPGKIKTIDTTGEVIYAQVGDTAVYRFPADTRSVSAAQQRDEIIVSPNPANTFIDVQPASRESLTLHDNTGRYLRTIIGTNDRVDVSDLPSGTYLLKIDGRTVKFNVER